MNYLDYIKFLFTSTNQHGIHSPFVFDLTTKGLYLKTSFNGTKSKKGFQKVIDYFSPKSITYFTEDFSLTEILKSNSITRDDHSEFIYFDLSNSDKDLNSWIHSKKDITQSHYIFVNQPHSNKKSLSQWNTLLLNEKVVVSIDCYYFGLLFFRKTQPKQHFKIRFNG